MQHSFLKFIPKHFHLPDAIANGIVSLFHFWIVHFYCIQMLLIFVYQICILQPHCTHKLVALVFLVDSLRFSIHKIMSLQIEVVFHLLFQSECLPFTCPIVWTRTSSTMLNRRGGAYILVLSQILKGSFYLLPPCMMLAVGFCTCPLSGYGHLFQFLGCSEFLSLKGIGTLKCFLFICRDDYVVSVLYSIAWCLILIYFYISN